MVIEIPQLLHQSRLMEVDFYSKQTGIEIVTMIQEDKPNLLACQTIFPLFFF